LKKSTVLEDVLISILEIGGWGSVEEVVRRRE